MGGETDFWLEPRPNLALLLRKLEGGLAANLAERNVIITRDHGDRPEINLRWDVGDGILRVVQVIVNPTSHDYPDEYTAQIVSSAWMDVDRGATAGGRATPGQGPARERLWFSKSFGDGYSLATPGPESSDPTLHPRIVNEVLETVYYLAAVTPSQLKQHSELPDTRTLTPGGIFVPLQSS